MEATEHKYSNEELVTLIKVNNNSQLTQYYYELLYNNNYSLFYKLSYKYSSISWYSLEDLLQESYISMVKAVQYYNKDASPFFNFLFFITNQYLHNKVNNASTKEQAERKKISYVSLFEGLHEDKDGNNELLLDTIADEEAQKMIDAVPEVLFIESLKAAEIEAIDTLLTKREAEVIKLYYGIDSAPFNTTEIADMLHITRTRVNECLRDSYRKLKRSKELQKFWQTEFEWR